MAGIFLVSLLSDGCVADNEEPEWSLGVGDALPSFSVTMNDGSVLNSKELTGREAVICFFNTDCPDCQRELPILQKEYNRREKDMVYICISREENEGKIADYWHDHGLTLPYSAQTDRRIYNLFANVGIPRIYRTNRAGIIVSAELAE